MHPAIDRLRTVRTLSACLLRVAVVAILRPGVTLADSLILKDGRFYEVPRLRLEGDCFIVDYQNGTVRIRKDLVREHFALDAAGDYAPQNPEEEEKVKKGLVPFEGRWVQKTVRDQKLSQRAENRRLAIEELRAHQEWRNRYKGSTTHFQFEYTVPQEVAAKYMDLFEVYFEVFAKEWKVSQPPKEGKLRVCFYDNRDDFQRIGNVPQGVLGYFRFVEPIELNFFFERRDERLTLDVLFHETNHYLFHLLTESNFQLPAWVNEGLAEYYGSSLWDESTKKMTVGQVQEGRLVHMLEAMDTNEMQDVTELLTAPQIDALQYAWAWSLCHLLMRSPQTEKRFKSYVGKLAKDRKLHRVRSPSNPAFEWVEPKASVELFKKTLEIDDLERFEQDWYADIRKFEVKTARGYHHAGLMCMQWQRPVRACLYFKKAIELYSTNPDTYENYGKALIDREMYDEAVLAIEKAIVLDPLNPYFYMTLGSAYLKMSGEESKGKGRSLQLLAMEMDPDNNRLTWEAQIEIR